MKNLMLALFLAGAHPVNSQALYDDITHSEARDIVPLLKQADVSGYLAERQAIRDFIFPGGLPARTNMEVEVRRLAEPWIVSGVQRTDLRAVSDQGTWSNWTFYKAAMRVDCLFIYHFGHDEGHSMQRVGGVYQSGHPEVGVRNLINRMLAFGCDVAVLSMPFSGDNYLNGTMGISGRDIGSVAAHNAMAPLETAGFTPMRWFIEPVVRVINFATSHKLYSRIGLAGKSGGGWTAVVTAAIDPRITHTFSVAGTMPLFLRRERTSDTGDWEQSGSALWDKVDYLDMYVLGALEPGRSLDNIWLRRDTCCFAGLRAHAFMPQLIGKAERMGVNGLSYLVENNLTPGHYLSPLAVDRIAQRFLAR